MRLRPRQKTFVERSVAALASRGNTLGVASTIVAPASLIFSIKSRSPASNLSFGVPFLPCHTSLMPM